MACEEKTCDEMGGFLAGRSRRRCAGCLKKSETRPRPCRRDRRRWPRLPPAPAAGRDRRIGRPRWPALVPRKQGPVGAEVDELFAQGEAAQDRRPKVIALISPHAGYRFSGKPRPPTTSSCVGRMVRRVVLLAISHHTPARRLDSRRGPTSRRRWVWYQWTQRLWHGCGAAGGQQCDARRKQ